MGSGGNNAQRAAEKRQADTDAAIKANTTKINAAYDSDARKGEIDNFTNAVRSIYREELDRQKGVNDRKLSFSLARSGQVGSSLDTDQHRKAGEDYTRGLIKAESGAQQQAAGLRSADEDARSRSLALVQGGGDIGTANANAATSLHNNLLSSMAGITATDIGNAFDSFGDIYSQSKQQADYRRGLGDYQNLYTQGFGFGGNGNGN